MTIRVRATRCAPRVGRRSDRQVGARHAAAKGEGWEGGTPTCWLPGSARAAFRPAAAWGAARRHRAGGSARAVIVALLSQARGFGACAPARAPWKSPDRLARRSRLAGARRLVGPPCQLHAARRWRAARGIASPGRAVHRPAGFDLTYGAGDVGAPAARRERRIRNHSTALPMLIAQAGGSSVVDRAEPGSA